MKSIKLFTLMINAVFHFTETTFITYDIYQKYFTFTTFLPYDTFITLTITILLILMILI